MTVTTAIEARPDPITVELPEPFHRGWNRLNGVTVDGSHLTIDPQAYFYRYENPRWLLCDWNRVHADLLKVPETPDTAVEQRVLEYVRTHGRRTSDAAKVLATGWHVYRYLFRDEYLTDPGLADVTAEQLRMLRECGTIMALNRVELDGRISVVGPAWMFPATCRVVFGLTAGEAEQLDELYHGTFFNEPRRIESVKAHAALGGRLVHGCQSAPDQSGGCVAPYGVDLARFASELAQLKTSWITAILDCGGA